MRVAGFLFSLVLFLVSAAMQMAPGIQDAQTATLLWMAAGAVLALTLFSIPAEWLWKRRKRRTVSGKDDPKPPPPNVSVGTNYGQVAGTNYGEMHQTVNVGPQPRTFRGRDLTDARIRLRRYAGTEIHVHANMNDAESQRFGQEVFDLLKSSGWDVEGHRPNFNMWSRTPERVEVHFPEDDNPAMRELAQCVVSLGADVDYFPGESIDVPRLMIGANVKA